jgi:hypothetical protein
MCQYKQTSITSLTNSTNPERNGRVGLQLLYIGDRDAAKDGMIELRPGFDGVSRGEVRLTSGKPETRGGVCGASAQMPRMDCWSLTNNVGCCMHRRHAKCVAQSVESNRNAHAELSIAQYQYLDGRCQCQCQSLDLTANAFAAVAAALAPRLHTHWVSALGILTLNKLADAKLPRFRRCAERRRTAADYDFARRSRRARVLA